MNAGAPREVGGLELPPGELLRHAADDRGRRRAPPGGASRSPRRAACSPATCEPEGRAELFGDPAGIAAGHLRPAGDRRPVGGRLPRQRPLAVLQRHRPRRGAVRRAACGPAARPTRDPLPIVVGIPREQLEVLDTWHTLGLRGTGSHDAVASELFVPARARLLAVRRTGARPPPLPLPGVRLLRRVCRRRGDGQRPRSDRRLRGAREGKVGQGSARTLAERSTTHAALADAEAALRGRRSALRRARSTPPGTPRRASGRSPSSCALAADRRDPRRRHRRRASPARCSRSRAARRSTTARRCSGASATPTRPPRTSRSAPVSSEIQGRVLLDQPADTTML